MDAEAGNDTQVTIKFVTKLPEALAVPEQPLAVPASIKRLGLSKIINHLLALEPVRPFDFAVAGKLLRGTLEDLLAAERISVETVVEIEYLPIVIPPRTKETAAHDEWVSAIDASIANEILSGSYDGVIREWTGNLECKWSMPAHETPITGVARVPQLDLHMIITSAQENTVKAWKLPTEFGKSARIFALLKGHKDVVQGIATSPSGAKCCSGSWDNSARVWPCGKELMDIQDGGHETGGEKGDAGVKKKRKVENGDGKVVGKNLGAEVEAKLVLEGHTAGVSAIQWPEEETIVTGGWDNTVRRWDAETGANIDTCNGRKVVHSISSAHRSSSVAFGGADTSLRIWDPRDHSEAIVLRTYKSHSGWIVGVKWSMNSDFHVVTCSYDETVKMWDIRGSVPLGTINSHEDKVLCVDWVGERDIVSGGADCSLKLHRADDSEAG